MEYIEDLVKLFAGKLQLGNFDQRIATSLADQAYRENPFTEKQAMIACRLIKKYRKQFVNLGITTVDSLLDVPKYKYPFRVVDRRKTAEIFKEFETKKKFICLKFPYSQEVVDKIKSNYNAIQQSKWDGDKKYWLLSLDEENIKLTINYLIPNGFELDEELTEYVNQYTQVQNDMENYLPMLDKINGEYVFKNIREKAKFSDLELALQQARMYAIPILSDTIIEDLPTLNIDNELLKIYVNTEVQNFFFNKNQYEKSKIVKIAKAWNTETVIFLNEGIDPSVLEDWILTLQACDVKLDEVAVLFRQKNEDSGEEFNNLIKNYGLNKAISENPKWIFLGSKYPKSLVKNKVHPSICICENKYVTPHYTIKSAIKNSMINLFYGDHDPKEKDIVVM
jgi:hypothetical protein